MSDDEFLVDGWPGCSGVLGCSMVLALVGLIMPIVFAFDTGRTRMGIALGVGWLCVIPAGLGLGKLAGRALGRSKQSESP